MVKNCCVLGCTSNTKRNPAISFFRFPTDVNLAQIWLQLIGRPEFKPSQYSVICQLHFTRDDFTSGSHHYPITGIGGQRKRLKTKAIPTQCLNGCTNPEMLAEMQMRAKNTVIIKPKTFSPNSQSPNSFQNKSEAAQLQQLLTSLMPALFANDGGDNFNQTMEQKFQSTSSSALPTYQSITHQSAPTSVSSSLPIISLPTTLQSIPLTPHTTTIQSMTNGHHDTTMSPSPPLVKEESVMKSMTNGSSSPLSGRLTMSSNINTVRNQSRVHQDLYAELSSSLQALKNERMNENHNNSNVVMSNSVREGLNQDPANPAYIIDVDTYQKLLDTVSQKSEKSIQTDRDVQIFALEFENKQLKEQLSQYELAFNSLINWTEGSITKEPIEPMICESKLVE